MPDFNPFEMYAQRRREIEQARQFDIQEKRLVDAAAVERERIAAQKWIAAQQAALARETQAARDREFNRTQLQDLLKAEAAGDIVRAKPVLGPIPGTPFAEPQLPATAYKFGDQAFLPTTPTGRAGVKRAIMDEDRAHLQKVASEIAGQLYPNDPINRGGFAAKMLGDYNQWTPQSFEQFIMARLAANPKDPRKGLLEAIPEWNQAMKLIRDMKMAENPGMQSEINYRNAIARYYGSQANDKADINAGIEAAGKARTAVLGRGVDVNSDTYYNEVAKEIQRMVDTQALTPATGAFALSHAMSSQQRVPIPAGANPFQEMLANLMKDAQANTTTQQGAAGAPTPTPTTATQQEPKKEVPILRRPGISGTAPPVAPGMVKPRTASEILRDFMMRVRPQR